MPTSMARIPVEFCGAGRALRIDFFRGLALHMIAFDHIPGDHQASTSPPEGSPAAIWSAIFFGFAPGSARHGFCLADR